MTPTPSRTLPILIAFCAACGGGGGDGDDAPGDDTPILELTPRISRACDLVTPTTMIGDGQVQDFTVAVDDDRHHALMNRSDQTVTLAELELEPVSLGTPVWSTAGEVYSTNASVAARESGGLGLAWSEIDGQTGADFRVAIAAVDDTGAAIGAVSHIPATGDVRSVTLLPRPGGFVLAWSEQNRLQFVAVAADGVPAGSPTTIASGPMFGSHLTRHGDGYAVAWSTAAGDLTEVHVALLDGAGAPRGEAVRLSDRDDRVHYSPFITTAGTDVLVAWQEHYYPTDVNDMGGHAIIRIARVDSAGEVVGPIRRLQASEPTIVNVNPSLWSVPGRLAMSWSRGHYINVCGGCVTDNTMQFVELDPTDLAPISEIVEITADAGLRSAPIVSANGNDYAYLMAIDRHATFDLASALVRCTDAP